MDETSAINLKARNTNCTMTFVIGVKDILLGRGALKHIANRVFRTYIDLYVYDYFHSTSREEKCRIIEESLYELDLSGYRFLKGNYYGEVMILEPKSCRSKVSLETLDILQLDSPHVPAAFRSHMLFEIAVLS
jgi:hypothetical protein